MTDYFALLGQPRQPWLDLDALKASFLEQSARLHPDRAHASGAQEQAAATARFAELNAAHNCLREPKDRLRHLLELETGAPPANVQSVPEDAVELCMLTGKVCRETGEFLAARERAASPLMRAQLFEQTLEWTGHLQSLQERIQLRRETLLAELRSMNDRWMAAPPAASPGRAEALPLRRLEEMSRIFSYLARCAGQIQERLAQLSF
ncbi:MAG TPA: hypothetical protein VGO59_20850 [Verrucomicrobiae bacterium]